MTLLVTVGVLQDWALFVGFNVMDSMCLKTVDWEMLSVHLKLITQLEVFLSGTVVPVFHL